MNAGSFKVHECAGMPKSQISVQYSREGDEAFSDAWSLIVRRESTEEDLEDNHYLENVGDTIWETVLEVSHCPFCGEHLNIERCVSEGNVLHRDYSGWSAKTS